MRVKIFLSFAVALSFATLFGWRAARVTTRPYVIELKFASSTAGQVRLVYDLGHGQNEEDSIRLQVAASEGLNTLRAPIPPGRYRALRIDPVDGAPSFAFGSIRIVDPMGETAHVVSPSALKLNDAIIVSVARADEIRATLKEGADDPFAVAEFQPVLKLSYGWRMQLGAAAPSIFVSSLVLWSVIALAGIAWQRRDRIGTWAERSPQQCVLGLAIIAASVASYPVVFLGKSYVSPSNGTALLYDRAPAILGPAPTRSPDMKTADIGAMMWQHLPYGTVQSRALLRDHELPLWNRYNSCGVTLLGQGQSMAGDPFHFFLILLTNGASWAWDFKFVLAKTLFAAGLGLSVWFTTHDVKASALVTIAAPFIGYYNFRVNHPAIFSFSYSPWILCAWLWLATATNRRRFFWGVACWFVANLTLIGSGTVKEAYLLLLSLNVTGAIAWLLTPVVGEISKTLRGAIIAFTGACWVLVSAPLWLNFLDALRQAHTAYDVPHVWQIPREWLIGLFDDLFYRELNERRVYVGSANFVFLLGTIWAFTQPYRLLRSPGAIACVIGMVGAILIGFEFVPRQAILSVPFIRNIYHLNNTFSAIAIVHLIVLSGWGFSMARTRLAQPKPWIPILVCFIVITAALTYLFMHFPKPFLSTAGTSETLNAPPGRLFFFANVTLMLLACGTLLLVAAHVTRKGLSLRVVIAAMVAMTALFYRHAQHPRLGWAEGYLTNLNDRADLRTRSPAVDFLQSRNEEPHRVAGIGNELFPGFASVHAFEGINGPDAIMNRYYREFAEAAGLTNGGDWRFPIDADQLPRLHPLLDFLGVRYLAGFPTTLSPDARYEKVGAFDLQIYRSSTAWPRAFFTDTLRSHQNVREFVALLRRQPSTPFAALDRNELSTSSTLEALARDSEKSVVHPARDYHLTSNTTRFRIDAPGPGVVVLNETYSPDNFVVTVNGERAAYFRVNHIFKGIYIPHAGLYEVAVRYWPKHMTLSLQLCGAGLVGLIALGIGCRFVKSESQITPAPVPF